MTFDLLKNCVRNTFDIVIRSCKVRSCKTHISDCRDRDTTETPNILKVLGLSWMFFFFNKKVDYISLCCILIIDVQKLQIQKGGSWGLRQILLKEYLGLSKNLGVLFFMFYCIFNATLFQTLPP